MDPDDPPYFIDNLLNPLPVTTPLLPHTDSYTSQLDLDRHSLNIPLDTLDGHGSLVREDTQIDLNPYDLFTLDPMTHLSLDY
jgi:hypothetical protein